MHNCEDLWWNSLINIDANVFVGFVLMIHYMIYKSYNVV